MALEINKDWFSKKLGELLAIKYAEDTDFTKQNYLLIKGKVYVEMRKAVAQKYGHYYNQQDELQEATERMLKICLRDYGVQIK